MTKIRTEQRDNGKMLAYAGSSRQGKSHHAKKDTKKHKRLAIWDTRGEYLEAGVEVVRTLSELAAKMKQAGKGPLRVALWADSLGDFEGFCQLAYAWVQLWPATILAEETSDVTNPGKAPPGWGVLLRKGLFYGGWIYATTQRPQESDKTIWGNATIKRCFTLVDENDRVYMARRMSSTPDALNMPQFHYLELQAGESQPTHHKPV